MKIKLVNYKLWGLLLLLSVIILGSVAFKFKWINPGTTYDAPPPEERSAVNTEASTSQAASQTTGSNVSAPEVSAPEPVAAATEPAETEPSRIAVDIGDSAVNQPDKAMVAIARSKVERAEDLEYGQIKEMVDSVIRMAGGLEGLIKDGQTVVIKPNLVTPIDYTLPGWQGRPLSPEVNGTTTDYRVTRAIVENVRKLNPNGRVYVMEGSAFPTEDVMKKLKYTPEFIPGVTEFIAIEKDSGGWKDYNSSGLVKVSLPDGLLHKEYYMNKKYYDADVLISVPVLKNHWSEVVSGAIKNVGIGATPANVYGISAGNTNRGNMVNHNNDDINKWLHDWFKCKPVNFVVVDGLQGVQNGPTPCYDVSGTTDIKQDQKNIRLMLAGYDSAAVDTISSLIMEIDPESVPYLKYFKDSGLGVTDTSGIRVEGMRVDEVREEFKGVAGRRIDDFAAPTLTVNRADMADDMLSISLTADKEASKVEIYADGLLKATVVPENPSNFIIDIKGAEKKAESVQIRVRAYDKMLNTTYADVVMINGNPVILKAGDYIAGKAEKAPAVDGVGSEECWKKVQWNEMKYPWGPVTTLPGNNDFTGRYKLVWTPEKLYALVEIRDDALVDIYKDPLDKYWEDDTVEIFIDEDHSGGDHQYNYNAFAYHIALDYKVVDLMKNTRPGDFTRHIKAVRTKKGDVYTWELAIDVYNDTYDDASKDNKPVKLSEGKELGSAIAYCDSDSNHRENFIGSMPVLPLGEDLGWRDASCFGTLRLVN